MVAAQHGLYHPEVSMSVIVNVLVCKYFVSVSRHKYLRVGTSKWLHRSILPEVGIQGIRNLRRMKYLYVYKNILGWLYLDNSCIVTLNLHAT